MKDGSRTKARRSRASSSRWESIGQPLRGGAKKGRKRLFEKQFASRMHTQSPRTLQFVMKCTYLRRSGSAKTHGHTRNLPHTNIGPSRVASLFADCEPLQKGAEREHSDSTHIVSHLVIGNEHSLTPQAREVPSASSLQRLKDCALQLLSLFRRPSHAIDETLRLLDTKLAADFSHPPHPPRSRIIRTKIALYWKQAYQHHCEHSFHHPGIQRHLLLLHRKLANRAILAHNLSVVGTSARVQETFGRVTKNGP